MKTFQFATLVLALSFLLVSCQKGSVEGTYALDKDTMLKNTKAKIKKLPAAKQKMAQFGLALISAMDVQLILNKGGSAEMNTTMPSFFKKGETSTKKEIGIWKLEGSKLTITTKSPNVQDKTVQDKTIDCTWSGKKITCAGKDKDGESMYFLKK